MITSRCVFAAGIFLLVSQVCLSGADIVLRYRVRSHATESGYVPTFVPLPLGNVADVGNFSIDWGDNSAVQHVVSPLASCGWSHTTTEPCLGHLYNAPGTYTVRLFASNESESLDNIRVLGWHSIMHGWPLYHSLVDFMGVLDWSGAKFASLRLLYANIKKTYMLQTPIPSELPDSVIDLSSLFMGCSFCNHSQIVSWDTRRVRSLELAFANTVVFNQPIGSWNVESVRTIRGAFLSAESFNQPLNSWNTSSLENANLAFSRTPVFNGNISTWNVERLRSIDSMFAGAIQFNQDLNSWNTSALVVAREAFSSAVSFNETISNWNMATVLDVEYMFYNSTNFCHNLSRWEDDLRLWHTPSVFWFNVPCFSEHPEYVPRFELLPKRTYANKLPAIDLASLNVTLPPFNFTTPTEQAPESAAPQQPSLSDAK